MGGAVLDGLPGWVTLLRAPNAGPMTLDGTNTWVLRAPGDELGLVIDPGPLHDGHLARIAGHGPFRSILVTHGHHDHVEGAARLSEMLGGTPVLAASPEHGAPFGVGPAGELGVVPVGEQSKGHRVEAGGLEVEVLATPGHTADSVCFLASHDGERAMFTGDTILGRG